jgi:RNA polymerase sigma-70 factor (ECF subfamily)
LVTDSSGAGVTNGRLGANSQRDDLGEREVRLRALMVRASAGDEAAYQILLQDLSEQLRSFYLRRLSRMPVEVEDLVQETLLAIHNQRHTYDLRRPFTAWVYAIARYKLIDLLRRRGRRELLTDVLDDTNEQGSGADLEASEAQRDLFQLLETLPDRQRLPIVHVKIDGLSVAEAAARTGMSISAVKIGIHRGLRALALRLRDDG